MQRPLALLRGHCDSAALLSEAQPFESLDCDPVEDAGVPLAIRDMTQRQALGRAQVWD